MAQSAMGPFYCPNDRVVYIDTAFFRDLETRFGGCDGKACRFAQAYVIAHEVGHHVQNLLGLLGKVQEAQQESGDRTEANQLQVRVELQADCLAGVWANRAQAKLQLHRAGRRRGGAADGGGDRRRPPAEAQPGPRGAGFVHARLLGAARALVPHGAERGERAGVQYVRGRGCAGDGGRAVGAGARCPLTPIMCSVSTPLPRHAQERVGGGETRGRASGAPHQQRQAARAAA